MHLIIFFYALCFINHTENIKKDFKNISSCINGAFLLIRAIDFSIGPAHSQIVLLRSQFSKEEVFDISHFFEMLFPNISPHFFAGEDGGSTYGIKINEYKFSYS